MRKIFSLFLAFVICLSLCACDSENGSNNSTQNNITDVDKEVGTGDVSTFQDVESGLGDNHAVPDVQDNIVLLENFEIGYFLETKCRTSGEFWVKATNSQNDTVPFGDVFIWTDSNLIPLLILDKDDFTICSSIYSGITLVKDEQNNKKVVLNADGDDVTSKYADVMQGEQVIGIWEDQTGVSVWTVQDADTFDSHITTLYAKDITGNVKMSWNSNDFPDLQLYQPALDEFEYISNGIYMFDQSVIDVTSGNGFCYPPSGNSFMVFGTDENGNVYTYHNNGSVEFLYKHSSEGNEIWKLRLYGKECAVGQFSNGLIYVKGQDGSKNKIHGFFDQSGECVIELDLNISNTPVYNGDYALVEIANEAGVKFVTILDKQGNMLFEPIKGTVIYSGGGTFAERTASSDYSLANIDEKIVILNTDGTYTVAPEYWNSSIYRCMQHNNTYYVIQDSQIVVYEYES